MNDATDFLLQARCHEDAFEFYQKSLQIVLAELNITSNILEYTSTAAESLCEKNKYEAELLAITLKQLGDCLSSTNKANEAIKYLEQSLAIQKKVSENQETNILLAQIFHSLGICCTHL